MAYTKGLKELYPALEIIADKTKLFDDPKNQTVSNFSGRSRAFLKIQDGCNNFCSYCIIPYIRNSLWSKPSDTIIKEIKTLSKAGFSEIVLTGICLGKYEGGLFALLKKIIEAGEDIRIRLSSIELNEIDDKILDLMADYPNKICHHLHIPLQSGCDKILHLMNRKYKSADWARQAERLRKRFDDICITTDVITGFPGETKLDHNQSLDFIKSVEVSRLHIFRYSDRANTKASRFDDKVCPQESKSRLQELLDIDKIKRRDFVLSQMNKTAMAVSIGQDKILTQNYISMPSSTNQKGIFPTVITDLAVI
jgi:threonylcarbamoyladenosine tRNA methylthiotransferase MtaB